LPYGQRYGNIFGFHCCSFFCDQKKRTKKNLCENYVAATALTIFAVRYSLRSCFFTVRYFAVIPNEVRNLLAIVSFYFIFEVSDELFDGCPPLGFLSELFDGWIRDDGGVVLVNPFSK